MSCRKEDAVIPKYYKDDERQGAQKTPQKASSYFFLQDTISIGQPQAIR